MWFHQSDVKVAFFSIFHRTKPEKVKRAQRPPIRQTCMKELTVLFMVLYVVEKTPKVREMVPALRDKCLPPPTHTHMLTLGSVQGVTPGCPKDTGWREAPQKFQRPPDINWVPSLHFPSFFKPQLMPGSRLVTWGKRMNKSSGSYWLQATSLSKCTQPERYPLSL